MREYLMSVICAAITVGIISVLVPEGEGGGLRRHVGLIGALCVVAILISPAQHLLEFLGGLSEGDWRVDTEQGVEQYEAEYSKYLASLGERELADGLAKLICEKFDISSEQCHVNAKIGQYDGQAVAEQITVILSGTALLRDPYAIEEFVSELLGCECTVVG